MGISSSSGMIPVEYISLYNTVRISIPKLPRNSNISMVMASSPGAVPICVFFNAFTTSSFIIGGTSLLLGIGKEGLLSEEKKGPRYTLTSVVRPCLLYFKRHDSNKYNISTSKWTALFLKRSGDISRHKLDYILIKKRYRKSVK